MLKTCLSDTIAIVTIDQPDRAVNVVSVALSQALAAEIARLAADATVTGIVLTSGKTGFAAGADLAEVVAAIAGGQPMTVLAALGQQIRAMERCGKPVVAALTGTALGAGLELAMGCHYRIIADDPQARLGLPEVTLGLLPGAGGTQRLPRLVGLQAALPMLTGGAPVDAARALALGLVDAVVPAADLVPAALRALRDGRVGAQQPWDGKGWQPPGMPVNAIGGFGAFILANATVAAEAGAFRPAPGAILSCVYEGLRLPTDRALAVEAGYFARLLAAPCATALIEARFLLRQRMARRGMRRADAGDPAQAGLAARVSAAMADAARAMLGDGWAANIVNNAALRAGLPAPLSFDPAAMPASGAVQGPERGAVLDRLALRLLDAGAVALTDAGDSDLADLVAMDLAGFPDWTGGPSRWRAAEAGRAAGPGAETEAKGA